MAREIAKAYEPQQIEPHWAEYWVAEQLFKADPKAPGPVFSIVIPPPNVTGSLHIGHMLEHTEIDVLTRWHRMRGYNTLYLPGTDHAGIATQRVVVKQLYDQGINYRDLGREEFEKRVWQWKDESGGTIQRQMREIGESCDWSREKFTLSPEMSRVVREVFVRLVRRGADLSRQADDELVPGLSDGIERSGSGARRARGTFVAHQVSGGGDATSLWWWRRRGRKRCSAIRRWRCIRGRALQAFDWTERDCCR